jgi:DNA-binding CsgD family transcriptional regulator
MPAGRPRHQDILTPREWQVLDLLRQGLTNEQIAARLIITADTAKFHVSEILSKLGVQTRQEAAAWTGRPRGIPIAGLPTAIAGKIGALSPLKLAAGAVLVAAAIGLTALAAGVLLTGSTPRPSGPTLAPDGRSGNEQVDALIDRLLHDDDDALARRYAGVSAREGSFDFGGIYNPSDVPADDWAARLAGAERVLHAVVQDPPEAYRQPGPGGVPLLATPREFDVLLLVDESGGASSAWRFSLLEGRVIDIVITPVSRTGPGGMRPNFSLRGLMPPVDQQASFLVLPPEETWPAPTAIPPSGSFDPLPAPVTAPTFAPDGRTGDPRLDAAIEALLNEDAAQLSRRADGLPASERPYESGSIERRVRVAEWADRLAHARRSLYAVYSDVGSDLKIVLAVDSGGIAAENWQFGIIDGRLAELAIHLPPPYLVGEQQRNDRLYFLARYTPYLPQEYARFYVLPPDYRLPQPPASRPLSARTGDTGVDSLLAELEARDASGLRAAIVPSDDLIVPACGYDEEMLEPAYHDRWAEETARAELRLHAVARLPAGYPWPGQHLIILVSEINSLSWGAMGLLERRGEIVAIVPMGSCRPESLYPPARFLLPPPPIGETFDDSRRPPFPGANAVLDAVYQEDEAALAALIDYPMVECAPPIGLGSPPPCPPGVSPGTPVQALKTGCHGDYSLPADAPREVIESLPDTALYAVVESGAQPGTLVAIFARRLELSSAGAPPRPFTYGVGALVIRDGRLVDFRPSGCGVQSVFGWLGPNARPDFLLPPS